MPKTITVTTDDDVLDKSTFPGANPNPEDGKGTPPADKKAGKKDTPPADDGQPKRVKVKVGEHELETDESSAAAINALMKQNTDLYAYLRNIQPPANNTGKDKDTKGSKADAEEYDYETELFANPKEAVKRLRAEIKAEITGELENKYNRAESEKEMWKIFYKENEDLKEEKWMVDAVLQRDYASLKDLPASEAMKKLATSVKKELLRLKGGRSDADNANTELEGSGNARLNAKKSGHSQEDEVPSLSALIRQRQEARRKAQSGSLRAKE